MKKANELIRAIISNPKIAEDGKMVNDLLREFHRGYPVENLLLLFNRQEPEIVKTAIFIAAELGSKAASFLPIASEFLDHPINWVRSDAIDCILTCATEANGKEIASVITMLSDLEGAIRWKVMEFLTNASLGQLFAGLNYFEKHRPISEQIPGLRWLSSKDGSNLNSIESLLCSDNPLDRKYGAIAAARLAPSTIQPLLWAAALVDEDVRDFADSMLKIKVRPNIST